jgi:endonuclease/exonuclease/phosphatase family metal-dependent hydrolase
MTMRLLSYNIHKGIGGRDRRYRLERIIQVIDAEKPDFVCLQEVDRHLERSRHDDQPKKLFDALQAKSHLFQLNVHFSSGGYGNLVLSRWPFRQSHQISLRRKRRKPRGAQLAVAETPEGPVHLVHWHLGLAERERHWQTRHLLEHAAFRESAHLPTLIVGDFNDWLNTLARGALASHGFIQVTAPRTRFRSFPAYWPVVSLDKAFVRGPLDIRHARIVHSRLAREASDHLPLVIDFHLKAAPPRPRADRERHRIISRLALRRLFRR